MTERLEDIAVKMVADGKGLLAADESTSTIKKRFDSINLESTETSRRDYREMLFRSDDAMKKCISGVILYEETLYQKAADGTPFVDIIKAAGSIPGIKVDTGAKPMAAFPGETITEGLDGLGERLAKYYEAGARFAKWRGVIAISTEQKLPTWGSIKANSQALARYAALCQQAGIVPIVEPEVLMDGEPATHSIDTCAEVTEWVLRTVFADLYDARVKLEGMILKPNMIIDGKKARKASVEEVAERTVRVLKATVPPAVPGIAFLSGGQSSEEATAHLSAMNSGYDLPWGLTFSYGRALQDQALKAWGGKSENVAAGQRAFTHRAEMNSLAAKGSWKKDLEKAA
ncbi:Fructose-bisphosphate aldolase [Neorhizobium galegae bv. officinalis bv. officinalis str. HAMBI 1141]|uniref:Fructose-bisphosphate aldolase n=1 Tax=Neorhizobium galegae bv. officinalis bv. officinalis str. HAMBI 1141 TaxID=1028801 RepID=A0A068T9T8_NEOGA|nr:class I fructose-bisphosphate aldolase [Neorhizobium galegae]CDN55287.1 Fructose-bisphosphate aldolase [Neorhizobium galegae bv. officinalis bv. officinalis str. HAMBI 1141]